MDRFNRILNMNIKPTHKLALMWIVANPGIRYKHEDMAKILCISKRTSQRILRFLNQNGFVIVLDGVRSPLLQVNFSGTNCPPNATSEEFSGTNCPPNDEANDFSGTNCPLNQNEGIEFSGTNCPRNENASGTNCPSNAVSGTNCPSNEENGQSSANDILNIRDNILNNNCATSVKKTVRHKLKRKQNTSPLGISKYPQEVHDLTDYLKAAIRKARGRGPSEEKTKRWPEVINRLLYEDNVQAKDACLMLDWWVEAYPRRNQFWPTIKDASSFRKGYDRLETLRHDDLNSPCSSSNLPLETAPKVLLEATEDLKKSDPRLFKFVQRAPDHFPDPLGTNAQFLQACSLWHGALFSKFVLDYSKQELQAAPEYRERRRISAAKELLANLSVIGFIQGYGAWVSERVKDWDDWGGNPTAFLPTGKMFAVWWQNFLKRCEISEQVWEDINSNIL